MEISKRSIITKSNVEVSTVIIHFESFKPVPLYHKESNYFNILKPLIPTIPTDPQEHWSEARDQLRSKGVYTIYFNTEPGGPCGGKPASNHG